MTTTLDELTLGQMSPQKRPDPTAEELATVELGRLAKEADLWLTRPDGLLQQFITTVLETAWSDVLNTTANFRRAARERLARAGSGLVVRGRHVTI